MFALDPCSSTPLVMKPGCGWLPGDWLFEDGLKRSLRALAAEDVDLGGYGEPKGFLPLRQLVRDLLAEQEIVLKAEQVLLTNGSSQAMDMVARRFVREGDTVLVDAPGYPNLHRVVQLVETHQVVLVENDIYADLDPEPRPSLASLD